MMIRPVAARSGYVDVSYVTDDGATSTGTSAALQPAIQNMSHYSIPFPASPTNAANNLLVFQDTGKFFLVPFDRPSGVEN